MQEIELLHEDLKGFEKRFGDGLAKAIDDFKVGILKWFAGILVVQTVVIVGLIKFL